MEVSGGADAKGHTRLVEMCPMSMPTPTYRLGGLGGSGVCGCLGIGRLGGNQGTKDKHQGAKASLELAFVAPIGLLVHSDSSRTSRVVWSRLWL